jgi:release factor glutamine methyltransferase
MTMLATILAGSTIGAARRTLAKAFRESGCDAPETDARVLIGHALALDHTGLVAAEGRVLTKGEMHAVTALAERRMAREPVARILGHKEFWGLRLALSPTTLVPRPETETLVEAALEAIDRAQARARPWRVADLGTGTGAILLALLSELPLASGVGTDLDPAALATARENARQLGYAQRAHFVACDFGAALAGGFDLVLSNPPYVASRDIISLAPEVRIHDPARALDGGPDGLRAYRAIAADAARRLAPGGALILEIGAGQSAAVTGLLAAEGLTVAPPRLDLAGIPRAIVAHRAMP